MYFRQTLSRFALALAAFAAVPSALGIPFSLEDGNTTVSDNNGRLAVWRLDDGPDNLFVSGFYFRTGETDETSVTSLPLLSSTRLAPNEVELSFAGTDVAADVRYEVNGGAPGSGSSQLIQEASITNTTNASLVLDLFLYVDIDILFDQTANLRNQARLVDPATVVQFDALAPISVLTTVSEQPSAYQIDESFLPLFFAFFTADGPTELSNAPGQGVTVPIEPGDVAFAFQWTRELAPGESFGVRSVSDYSTVPEPGALVLVGMGLGLVALRRGWRRGRG